MAQQTINNGTTANDHTGDPPRTAWTKANANFTELYGRAPNFISASAVESAVHTGDTTETTLATIVIPANRMGLNGVLRVTVQYRFTGTAGAKTMRYKFGGTAFFTLATASSALSARTQAQIANRNAANSQVAQALATSWGESTVDIVTMAIDTTAAVNLTITGQLANSGDSVAVESYLVELIGGAQ